MTVVPGRALPLPDERARVLRAVVTQAHPTVRSVALEAEVTVGCAYRHLLLLRHQGLVSWAIGPNGHQAAGTLRANVTAHRPAEALAREAAGCDDPCPTTTTPEDR